MVTKQSPRIEDGVIKWYEGDAFYLDFDIADILSLKPIELGENDKVVIEFFDCRDRIKKIYDDVKKNEEGLFPVHIDSETTRIFRVGKYHYKIEVHKNNSETIQTIESCGNIEVEGFCKCQA